MELKPCPFCGGEQGGVGGTILQYGISGKEWMHRLNGCILAGYIIKDAEAWNRRAEK